MVAVIAGVRASIQGRFLASLQVSLLGIVGGRNGSHFLPALQLLMFSSLVEGHTRAFLQLIRYQLDAHEGKTQYCDAIYRFSFELRRDAMLRDFLGFSPKGLRLPCDELG